MTATTPAPTTASRAGAPTDAEEPLTAVLTEEVSSGHPSFGARRGRA